ncbi:MAG: hypothetical protein IJ012_00425 [Clostridia bacterium]|nr:hypothetical protein [Clostridia bacterium]
MQKQTKRVRYALDAQKKIGARHHKREAEHHQNRFDGNGVSKGGNGRTDQKQNECQYGKGYARAQQYIFRYFPKRSHRRPPIRIRLIA